MRWVGFAVLDTVVSIYTFPFDRPAIIDEVAEVTTSVRTKTIAVKGQRDGFIVNCVAALKSLKARV